MSEQYEPLECSGEKPHWWWGRGPVVVKRHLLPPTLFDAIPERPGGMSSGPYPTRAAAMDALAVARAKVCGGDAQAELLAAAVQLMKSLNVVFGSTFVAMSFQHSAADYRRLEAAIAQAGAES